MTACHSGRVERGPCHLLPPLQLAAAGYQDRLERDISLGIRLDAAYLAQRILARHKSAEDGMFTCQVWARHERDEEPVPRLSVPVSSDVHARNGGPDILATVGVLAAIGGAHQASSVYVPPSEVFIGVLASIYTDAPRPIVMFDVAAL